MNASRQDRRTSQKDEMRDNQEWQEKVKTRKTCRNANKIIAAKLLNIMKVEKTNLNKMKVIKP